MAEKDKSTPEAKAETATAPAAPSKPKFALERLRYDCRKLFGVTTSTFDGAICGLNGEFTLEQIREKIKKFQCLRVLTAGRKKEGK